MQEMAETSKQSGVYSVVRSKYLRKEEELLKDKKEESILVFMENGEVNKESLNVIMRKLLAISSFWI